MGILSFLFGKSKVKVTEKANRGPTPRVLAFVPLLIKRHLEKNGCSNVAIRINQLKSWSRDQAVGTSIRFDFTFTRADNTPSTDLLELMSISQLEATIILKINAVIEAYNRSPKKGYTIITSNFQLFSHIESKSPGYLLVITLFWQ